VDVLGGVELALEGAPAATGTPVRPIRDRIRSALRVVFSSGAFPATVVTARRSSSGAPQANISATASSWPGSTSKITGMELTLPASLEPPP
jgi:hypothetical protein